MSKLANRWFFQDISPNGQLDDFVRTVLSLVSGRLDGNNMSDAFMVEASNFNADKWDGVEYDDHLLYMEVMG